MSQGSLPLTILVLTTFLVHQNAAVAKLETSGKMMIDQEQELKDCPPPQCLTARTGSSPHNQMGIDKAQKLCTTHVYKFSTSSSDIYQSENSKL